MTKLEFLTTFRDDAQREQVSATARLEALQAAIAELPEGSAGREHLEREALGVQARLGVVAQTAAAFDAAYQKEPKPPADEPTKEAVP